MHALFYCIRFLLYTLFYYIRFFYCIRLLYCMRFFIAYADCIRFPLLHMFYKLHCNKLYIASVSFLLLRLDIASLAYALFIAFFVILAFPYLAFCFLVASFAWVCAFHCILSFSCICASYFSFQQSFPAYMYFIGSFLSCFCAFYCIHYSLLACSFLHFECHAYKLNIALFWMPFLTH